METTGGYGGEAARFDYTDVASYSTVAHVELVGFFYTQNNGSDGEIGHTINLYDNGFCYFWLESFRVAKLHYWVIHFHDP